jgi:hypothetical protein
VCVAPWESFESVEHSACFLFIINHTSLLWIVHVFETLFERWIIPYPTLGPHLFPKGPLGFPINYLYVSSCNRNVSVLCDDQYVNTATHICMKRCYWEQRIPLCVNFMVTPAVGCNCCSSLYQLHSFWTQVLPLNPNSFRSLFNWTRQEILLVLCNKKSVLLFARELYFNYL